MVTRPHFNRDTPSRPTYVPVGNIDKVQDPGAQDVLRRIVEALAELSTRLNPDPEFSQQPHMVLEVLAPRAELQGNKLRLYKYNLNVFPTGLPQKSSLSLALEVDLGTIAGSASGSGGTTTTSTLDPHSHNGYYDGGWAGFLSGGF